MRRICGSVSIALIALFVLPFTAPFPTCDLGELLGLTPIHHQFAQSSKASTLEDGTYSVLPTLNTEPGRLKLSVVTVTAVVCDIARDQVVFHRVPFRPARPHGLSPHSQTVLRL